MPCLEGGQTVYLALSDGGAPSGFLGDNAIGINDARPVGDGPNPSIGFPEKAPLSSLLAGSRNGVLGQVTPFSLHGEAYYHLLYTFDDDPGRGLEARVAHEAIYPSPTAGNRVTLHAVMGVITGVEKR